jgi:ABC-2 type transport system permease protein
MVVWVAWELDIDIRHGTLSPKLLRPLDPLWSWYAGHFAERIMRLPLLLILVVLFTWLAGARFTADPWAYPAALSLAFLGFSARFLWEYIIGLLAFWTESSTSFQEVVWLIYAALGGIFAPLAFYPQWVQNIAVWTPFPYMLGLPAQLLAGKASLADAGRGALVLLGWLVVFWVVRLLVWRMGLRKYGAVGA